MPTAVVWNGTSYAVPATSEEDWGGTTKVDGLLIALVNHGFQKTGGLFTLSADADFGATAGLKAGYYKSRGTPATAGVVRLGNTETIAWLNAAGNANLALTVNASNLLTFNSLYVPTGTAALTASRAVVTDSSGLVASSAVTSTELALLSGKTAVAEDGNEHNWIHNGAFDFWQENITKSIGATSHVADRWIGQKSGGTFIVTQDSDVPTQSQSGFQSKWSLKVACTVVNAAGASEYCRIKQAITGYDYIALKGKTVTLTFWVKASKTGISCIGLQNHNTSSSYVAEYTINAANTWEKKTVTFTISPTSESASYATLTSLYVFFTLWGGSTLQQTAGTWQANTALCTANQVNHGDANTNTFFLSQVAMSIGSTAPLRFWRCGKSIDMELGICEAYFEKSYDIDVLPGAVTTVGALQAYTLTTTRTAANTQWRRRKTGSPSTTSGTVTLYGTDGTSGVMYDTNASSGLTATELNKGPCGAAHTSTTATTVGNRVLYHYVADFRIT